MMYLLKHGTAEQQALAIHCNVDKAGITRVLKTMEAQQLIERTRNRDDLRQKQVELTASGRSLARKVHKCDEEALEQVFRGLQTYLDTLDEALVTLHGKASQILYDE
jgi:DNA-binding MarR family transcriptional regulator